jgi:hypothetical protein
MTIFKAIAILCCLLVGVSFMAYLSEVSGKMRTKTLLIGDGVDLFHSPLQVEPQMATDMLNLSSRLFPSLSVRERTVAETHTMFYSESQNGSFLTACDPFMDSAGNIHLAILVYYPDAFFPTLKDGLKWYIRKAGATDFEYQTLGSPTFAGEATAELAKTGLAPTPQNRFATGNFCEMLGKVYFSFSADSGGSTEVNVLEYDIDTEDVDFSSVNVYDMRVARLNPICSYVNRLFVGVDNQIKFSATAAPDDFTTAFSSGSLPLTQGGTITSMTPMRDRVLVSTKTALFLLFGSEFETFQIALLSDNLGILNPKSIVERNGIVYFVGSDRDVYEYNGNILNNITREPMQTGSRSGVRGGFSKIPVEETENLQLSYYDNRIFLVSEPNQDPDVATIDADTYVFDLVKRRWYINNHTFDVTPIPAQAQIETATIVGTITLGGTVNLTLTAADITSGVPYPFTVVVSLGDNAATVAGKIRNAMAAVSTINSKYTIGGTGADIKLTRIIAGTQDSTLNLAYTNGTCTGLTPDATSTNTQSGFIFPIGSRTMLMIGGNEQTLVAYSERNFFPFTTPMSTKIAITEYVTYPGDVSPTTPFEWVSPAYQLNPTGTQALKAMHFTYNCPSYATVGVYISYTVDEDDFIQVATLHKSGLKQNSRQSISLRNIKQSPWVRVKIKGTGDVVIYNMTLEWRVMDRVQ